MPDFDFDFGMCCDPAQLQAFLFEAQQYEIECAWNALMEGGEFDV